MENSKANKGVGGICTIVFIVFLILKLAGIGIVATWSWWWVTSPLWFPFAIAIVCLVIYLFIVVIGTLRKSKK